MPQGRETSSPYTYLPTCMKCISFKPHADLMFSPWAAVSSAALRLWIISLYLLGYVLLEILIYPKILHMFSSRVTSSSSWFYAQFETDLLKGACSFLGLQAVNNEHVFNQWTTILPGAPPQLRPRAVPKYRWGSIAVYFETMSRPSKRSELYGVEESKSKGRNGQCDWEIGGVENLWVC